LAASTFDDQFEENGRATVNRKTLLVLDAAEGFGAALAGKLRGQGHDVWTLQKKPDDSPSRWVSVDMLEPHQAVSAVAQWIAEGVAFDGVCSCARHNQAAGSGELTLLDLQSHVTANVLGPLMLLLYLAEFKLLSPGARAVFCVGEDSGSVAYRTARRILEPAVRTCLQGMDFPHSRYFVNLLGPGVVASGVALEHVRRLLVGELTPPTDEFSV